jgi:isopentenyl diphosphate isomerase/L-lactate dehydrogenase-like FMN-dependent dehydrogenase
MAADLDRVFSVEEARRLARRRLPRVLFDYIDGGAGDEVTMQANLDAFRELAFRPHVGERTADPAIATTVLGTPVDLPVLLGPCGLISMMHPGGAVAAARAAAAAGTISVLSSVAGTPLEEVAASSNGPRWFQVYAPGGRDEAAALADRAAAGGYQALMITVDTAVLGRRERDLRHGITMPLAPSARLAAHLIPQVLARPGWLFGMAKQARSQRRGASAPSSQQGSATGTDVDAFQAGTQLPKMASSPFTWADIAYLRDRWTGPLVVKGLVTGDDAAKAADAGADAVVVSNHGGRQLDGAPATMRMLPEVLDAVGDRVEVLVDGGVRRGGDVARALSLGARAVLIGRPYLYGVSIAGQAGVEHVLALLAAELRHTLTLLGCAGIDELGPHTLVMPRPPAEWP